MSHEDVDRFVEEQIFEEDVRAVLSMMRPNKRERLCGWNEFPCRRRTNFADDFMGSGIRRF